MTSITGSAARLTYWKAGPALRAAVTDRGHQAEGAGSRTAKRRLEPPNRFPTARSLAAEVAGVSGSTATPAPIDRIQLARASASRRGRWSSTEAEGIEARLSRSSLVG